MKTKLSAYLLVALSSIFLSACSNKSTCISVNDVVGKYTCSGYCVVTTNGKKEVFYDEKETDVISFYPDTNKTIYQNNITGGGGFKETEIGVLSGLVMRTATSEVSDEQYPVLEEYIFKTNNMCKATGFTKVVLNPTQDNFKACNILCKKQ